MSSLWDFQIKEQKAVEKDGVLKLEVVLGGKEAHNIEQKHGKLGLPVGALCCAFSSLLSSPELPAALSPCRHVYIMVSTLVTSVGNGPPSNCSQGHSHFTVGPFAVLFPPWDSWGPIYPQISDLRIHFRTNIFGSQMGWRETPLSESALHWV